MIKCLNTVMLCAILVAGAAIAAYAADPTPPQTQTQTPQVATGNGIPHPSTQMPVPQTGPSTGIPSEQYQSAGSGETEQGSYYSKKGFGPKTH